MTEEQKIEILESTYDLLQKTDEKPTDYPFGDITHMWWDTMQS